MKLWKRLLCALTRHSWVPLRVNARVFCECSFCGTKRWITFDCFEQRS
jgi:hypothetical protein